MTKYKKKIKKEVKESKINYFPGLVFLLLVAIILIYVRVVPYVQGNSSLSFSPHILFDDMDSCYHARRMIYIAQHNMRLPFHDPLLAYPRGATPIWSPFYDWISAFPAYIVSLGSPSDYFVVRIATIMNVLFGLMQLFFIGLLLYRVEHNLSFSALAVFLIGMTNLQTVYTSLKTIDHNSLSLMLFTLALFQMHSLMTEDTIRKKWLHVFFASVVLALLFWTWPGAYLYIGVIFLTELMYLLLTAREDLCRLFTLIYALAGILICPLAYLNCTLSKEYLRFEYVSFVTVLFMLSISLMFTLIKSIYELKAKTNKALVVIKICAVILLLLIISYYLLNPLMEGFKYAEAQNKWLSTIMESKPILFLALGSFQTFTVDKIIMDLSYLIFIFPIAFCLILLRVIKLPKEMYCIVIVASVIFSFLVFKQMKYAIEFAIPYGISLSFSILWIYRKLGAKRKATIIVLLVVIISFSQYPYKTLFKKEIFMPHYAYQKGFQWLREEIQSPKVEINTGMHASEGVMAPWDFGHHVQLYSGAGTIADNFGFIYMDINPWEGFYDMAKFFLAENETDAVSILKKYKSNYVIVPSDSSVFESYVVLIDKNPDEYFGYSAVSNKGERQIMVELKEKYYRTIGFRLSEINGSANPADDERMMKFNALQHFKLVYQLPSFSLNGRTFPPGTFKISQYVTGATLEVPESATSPYKVEAYIQTNDGSHFYYRQYGTMDKIIIVPYPTATSSRYPYAKLYTVTTSGSVYEFANVTEQEVFYGTP